MPHRRIIHKLSFWVLPLLSFSTIVLCVPSSCITHSLSLYLSLSYTHTLKQTLSLYLFHTHTHFLSLLLCNFSFSLIPTLFFPSSSVIVSGFNGRGREMKRASKRQIFPLLISPSASALIKYSTRSTSMSFTAAMILSINLSFVKCFS